MQSLTVFPQFDAMASAKVLHSPLQRVANLLASVSSAFTAVTHTVLLAKSSSAASHAAGSTEGSVGVGVLVVPAPVVVVAVAMVVEVGVIVAELMPQRLMSSV